MIPPYTQHRDQLRQQFNQLPEVEQQRLRELETELNSILNVLQILHLENHGKQIKSH